jgi:hypothetical protein
MHYPTAPPWLIPQDLSGIYYSHRQQRVTRLRHQLSLWPCEVIRSSAPPLPSYDEARWSLVMEWQRRHGDSTSRIHPECWFTQQQRVTCQRHRQLFTFPFSDYINPASYLIIITQYNNTKQQLLFLFTLKQQLIFSKRYKQVIGNGYFPSKLPVLTPHSQANLARQITTQWYLY